MMSSWLVWEMVPTCSVLRPANVVMLPIYMVNCICPHESDDICSLGFVISSQGHIKPFQTWFIMLFMTHSVSVMTNLRQQAAGSMPGNTFVCIYEVRKVIFRLWTGDKLLPEPMRTHYIRAYICHQQVILYHVITSIPAWAITGLLQCEMELLVHSQFSTVAPLKFGYN